MRRAKICIRTNLNKRCLLGALEPVLLWRRGIVNIKDKVGFDVPATLGAIEPLEPKLESYTVTAST